MIRKKQMVSKMVYANGKKISERKTKTKLSTYRRGKDGQVL
jgi:hypothetical protein